MKRLVLASASALVALAFCVACASPFGTPFDASSIPLKDAAVGVIETRGNQLSSRIVFFDDKLNELGAMPFQKATMGGVFYDACIYDGALHTIPQGYDGKADGEEVLEVSLSDLSVKSHRIKQPAMNAVAANEKFVFTCNTLNNVSYISRCDKDTGEVVETTLDGEYVTNLLWGDDSLYAFVTHEDTDNPKTGRTTSYVVRFDEHLEKRAEYDVSACGSGQYRGFFHEGVVYFTSLSEAEGSSPNRVGTIAVETGEVGWIQLDRAYPLGLALVEGKLYVTHHDVVANANNSQSSLSVCDLATGDIAVHELPHGADQMVLRGDKLYFLDGIARTLHAYDARTLEQLYSTHVEPMDSSYSYLSNLFAVGA